jgi:hypothetical protein
MDLSFKQFVVYWVFLCLLHVSGHIFVDLWHWKSPIGLSNGKFCSYHTKLNILNTSSEVTAAEISFHV